MPPALWMGMHPRLRCRSQFETNMFIFGLSKRSNYFSARTCHPSPYDASKKTINPFLFRTSAAALTKPSVLELSPSSETQAIQLQTYLQGRTIMVFAKRMNVFRSCFRFSRNSSASFPPRPNGKVNTPSRGKTCSASCDNSTNHFAG